MNKYITFFILLIIFIISTGAACAQDFNQTEQLEIDGENEIVADLNSPSKSFKDLNESICDPTIHEFDMQDNYEYDESDGDYSNGIEIKKDNFVINGNNHIIDAKNKASIFTINGKNITINNLVFKNGINQAINIIGHNITTNNVTFINCIAGPSYTGGGAIYAFNSTYISNNDKFTDNYANYTGAAIISESSTLTINNAVFKNEHAITWSMIYATESYLNIINTTFANTTSKYATAIHASASIVNIKRSKFINLFANMTAGALAFKGTSYVIIDECEFINLSSSKNAGAIFADINGEEGSATGGIIVNNTLFDNCSSMFGGAILQLGGKANMTCCNFTNNRAEYNGGAVYISDTETSIENCIFDNNEVGYYEGYPTYGGAVFCDYSILLIFESEFNNNVAPEGGAIYAYDSEYHLDDLELNDNIFNAIRTYFDSKDSEMGSYSGTDNLKPDDFDNTVYYEVIIGEGIVMVLVNQTNITDIPPVYDLREEHLVTPVRNQGHMGSCWVFGMTAALESAVLKTFGIETDFSENNMQNSMLTYSKNGIKEMYEGGLNIFSSAYLLSWLGAFPQDYDTYDELGKISPAIRSDGDLHVQDIIFIPHTPGDNDSINNVKMAILKYGALDASIFAKSRSDDGESIYYNENTYAQYNNNSNASNHEVCVVGWDDTFSMDNFGITPPGDGAWIVKNSWGTGWGDKGYFYVSYYDQTFSAVPTNVTECFTAIVLENTLPYNNNYQYDISGLTRFYENGDLLEYANIFESYEDDLMAAVGTYFIDEGVEYKIEVEINDEAVYSQSGISPYYGYHTIKLDKYVPIKKGDKFRVSVISNSMPISENTRFKFEDDISEVVYPDGSWESLSEQGIVACLKVYTLPYSIKTENMTVYYSDCKEFIVGANARDVFVEVSINGIRMNATADAYGMANFTLPLLNPGTYTMETSFNNITVINTVEVLSTIIAPDSVTMAYNANPSVKVTLYDMYGNALANMDVDVNHDGKTSKMKTDSQGVLTITIADNIGTHSMKFTNPATGEAATTSINVVSRFSGNKNVNMYYYDGSKYSLRVYGDDGKVVGKNQVVSIKIGKNTYKVKTNANGYAILKIANKFKPGTYKISATYKGQAVKNTLKVKQSLKSKKTVKVKRTAKKLVLKATLKNGKKALKGKKITFKFKGKTYKAKTNKKGIAKVTIKKNVIKKLKKGKKYTVKISYLKDTIKTKVIAK